MKLIRFVAIGAVILAVLILGMVTLVDMSGRKPVSLPDEWHEAQPPSRANAQATSFLMVFG